MARQVLWAVLMSLMLVDVSSVAPSGPVAPFPSVSPAPSYPRAPASAESESLAERLRRGDTDALARVYDEHHDAVRAFALRLVGEAEAADDLAHEVFPLLPNAMKSFRGESSLRTFLIGMVMNRSRRHIRSSVRRRAAFKRLAVQPISPSADPEELTSRKELASTLTRALAQLSALHRDAFLLCEVEELSSSEAAAMLGTCEGTVRSRVYYAKRQLRALLGATQTAAASTEAVAGLVAA